MRRLILAAALAAAGATAAGATDVTAMTPTESDAFGAAVRSYLMENPQVLMDAIGVLEQRQAAADAAGDTDRLRAEAEALTSDPGSWSTGNPDGDVTVVEFMDYRCGFCRRAFPEVAELVEGDGNIRLVVKEFPILGPQSLMASQFAIAVRQIAGDEAYGSVHDALMTMRGDVTEDALRALADDGGLDTDAVMARMAAPEVQAVIDANHALGRRLSIDGTPSFVFGDRMVRGYVPLDAMQQMVADLRAD